MPCPNEHTIQDYLAERLGNAEADAVRKHLAECGKCERMVELLSDETLHGPPKDGGKAAGEQPDSGRSRQRQTTSTRSEDDLHSRFGNHSRLGRFDLKHRLGFGGFGVVYLA